MVRAGGGIAVLQGFLGSDEILSVWEREAPWSVGNVLLSKF